MALGTLTVGIDHSKPAEDALRWAVGLAAWNDSVVRAVSTWQMPLVASLPEGVDGLPTVEFMTTQCAALLAETLERNSLANVVDQIVLEGAPGPTLAAQGANADLLVVGRTGHGRRRGVSRLAEIALGSTARHCVHHASIPVATVPASSRWKDPAAAVVGIDGSQSSFAALEWAMTNLPPTTEVHVIRAFAPWTRFGLVSTDPVEQEANYVSIRSETKGWIDAVLNRIAPSVSAPPTTEVVVANPRDALAQPGYDVDVIVVGERGRTGVAARVLGSISDHMVRYASCPVVVVPDRRPTVNEE